jgi:hypothetical protein
MMTRPLRRRDLLLGCTAVLGVGAALASARQAGAFSIETVPEKSQLAVTFASRCGGDSAHAEVAARLEAILLAEDAPKGTTLTQSAACPLCGCAVTVSRTVE